MKVKEKKVDENGVATHEKLLTENSFRRIVGKVPRGLRSSKPPRCSEPGTMIRFRN
jgi:hypothetical protein